MAEAAGKAAESRGARRTNAWMTGVFAIAAAFALLWALAPGPDTYRSFEAQALGRAESDLWRFYYERRYGELAAALVLNDRRAFGLSPWDSLRSGISAALAARTFQASRSRAEAQAALPELTHHFAVLAHATHSSFNAGKAAQLELAWWQLRRETDSGPAAYAPAIAAATAYIYGLDPGQVADYARLRAQAMDLRDRRGAKISRADWRQVSALLEHAYAALRADIDRAAPTPAHGA